MDIMTKYGVMLGSDPELLLLKEVLFAKKYFPIIGLLGHDKDNPLFIDDSGYRTLQEDNVALEYTTHPTATREDFINEQFSMYNYAKAKAAEFNLEVSNKIAVQFDIQMLQSEQAKTFGCDLTFDAYTKTENQAPNSNTAIRSVGGHIHISYNNPNDDMSIELAKLLDLLFIKYEYIHMVTGIDEALRRNLYGKAGEIRLKSYGFEWRVPSSTWVRDENNIGKMWDLIEDNQ